MAQRQNPVSDFVRACAAICIVLVFASACATPVRTEYTSAERRIATPVGFAGVRFTSDDQVEAQRLSAYIRRLRSERETPVQILSLSGGGAKGAFGAGVLYGWSESGTRPTFDVVTGISTGALAAPFSFLGPRYDDTLRSSYTDGGSAGLLDFLGISALFRPNLFSAEPLEQLVERFIDDAVVRDVAAEYAKGRRLIIATTNLDTQELVLWNMGAIATAGTADALALFRQVMIASASIPGIFPPVMIDVVAGERQFKEMHVDGSTIASFFAVPESMLLSTDLDDTGDSAHLYVLVNGSVEPAFSVTRLATLSILERSFETAAKSHTKTELFAVAAFAQRNGVSLQVSHVPPGLNASPLDFNQTRMTALFEAGRQLAIQRQAWTPYVRTDDAPLPTAP